MLAGEETGKETEIGTLIMNSLQEPFAGKYHPYFAIEERVLQSALCVNVCAAIMQRFVLLEGLPGVH